MRKLLALALLLICLCAVSARHPHYHHQGHNRGAAHSRHSNHRAENHADQRGSHWAPVYENYRDTAEVEDASFVDFAAPELAEFEDDGAFADYAAPVEAAVEDDGVSTWDIDVDALKAKANAEFASAPEEVAPVEVAPEEDVAAPVLGGVEDDGASTWDVDVGSLTAAQVAASASEVAASVPEDDVAVEIYDSDKASEPVSGFKKLIPGPNGLAESADADGASAVEPAAHVKSLKAEAAVISELKAEHLKSFAAGADLSLQKLSASELSPANGKLTVDTFQHPASYRGALEVYHASADPIASKSMGLASAGAIGDLPDDVKKAANNATSNPTQIVGTVTSLDWSTGTAAVIFIAVGLVMAFFGYRLFKVVLFLGGFVFFAALAYIGLNAIRNGFPSTADAFANNGAVIYIVTVIVVGLLGGGLTLCLWRLGLVAIGGLLGFVLATFIQQSVQGGLIKSEVGRIVFIVVLIVAFAIAIIFVERPLLILGTSVPGSYSVIWGLDIFIGTGFKDAVVTLLRNQGTITVTTTVWIMIGSFILLSLISTAVQFRVTGKNHHNMGRGGYKNLEKQSSSTKA